MNTLPTLLLMTALQPPAEQGRDPGPGIAAELARFRAATISKVRYDLEFNLDKGMDEMRGKVRIRFAHKEDERGVVLDFAGQDLSDISINGAKAGAKAVKRVHNHLMIASSLLKDGENTFAASFSSKVAATGTPLTRYVDTSDGSEYLYTLVVPADAHRLFPCFDQPDLKGAVTLTLTVPKGWIAVANGETEEKPEGIEGDRLRFRFKETKPISTYLMAFAAGPFHLVAAKPEQAGAESPLKGLERPPRLYVRGSKLEKLETERIVEMHLGSLAWCEDYFDLTYPFGKLDVVLVPGFPYGGMEHAGAIFYRESALVFDHEPTAIEQMRRSTLIYHEVSHQWFGNLVTMEWFDDLWLKEGFATFMSYSILEDLEPEKKAWLRFHQRVKPSAYRVDATAGTTPIFQELQNLVDAKSNYGPIVYNKAPAVLRELMFRVGTLRFRKGVRSFLKKHAWSNARWSDLLDSFVEAGAEKLDSWSSWWILTAGMPRVRAVWRGEESNHIGAFEVRQEAIQDWVQGTWPMTIPVLVVYPNGSKKEMAVTADKTSTPVKDLTGSEIPAWVLLNHTDVAYGQFLLDEHSREYLLRNLRSISDPLLRAVAFTAMYETVREAELDPAKFARMAIDMLEAERDPLTHAQILGALRTTIERYLDDKPAQTLRNRTADLLRVQLTNGELKALALQTYRSLVRLGRDEDTFTLCERILEGKFPIPGLKLGAQDRFLTAAALLAAGRPGAREKLERLSSESKGQDLAKYAYLAAAAEPKADTKERYFKSYLEKEKPPEQWVSGSISYFHWPGQEELTLPYLPKALDQVEWVKEHRKIFFMPAWIDGFINAHSSRIALQAVENFLQKRTNLAPDIRRKILQSVDGLRRAVKIRSRQ